MMLMFFRSLTLRFGAPIARLLGLTKVSYCVRGRSRHTVQYVLLEEHVLLKVPDISSSVCLSGRNPLGRNHPRSPLLRQHPHERVGIETRAPYF